jgi:hypothetical protein
MAAIPKFDEANLQAISDILGETSAGLTGSEIGRYLKECDISDPIPQMTKRHRLFAALSAKQSADQCANNVLRFITELEVVRAVIGHQRTIPVAVLGE